MGVRRGAAPGVDGDGSARARGRRDHGPYAEAKEYLGGFWIIEVADLDEALAWAREATVACRGPIEVRPFQDEPAAE